MEGDVRLRPKRVAGQGPALTAQAAQPRYDRSVPQVAEIMARDVLGVGPETTVVEAARRMHERRVGAVVVLDRERLVGILTERDVLRAVATGDVDGPVSGAKTRAPQTVEPAESAPEPPLIAYASYDWPPLETEAARKRSSVNSNSMISVSYPDARSWSAM